METVNFKIVGLEEIAHCFIIGKPLKITETDEKNNEKDKDRDRNAAIIFKRLEDIKFAVANLGFELIESNGQPILTQDPQRRVFYDLIKLRKNEN